MDAHSFSLNFNHAFPVMEQRLFKKKKKKYFLYLFTHILENHNTYEILGFDT